MTPLSIFLIPVYTLSKERGGIHTGDKSFIQFIHILTLYLKGNLVYEMCMKMRMKRVLGMCMMSFWQ